MNRSDSHHQVNSDFFQLYRYRQGRRLGLATEKDIQHSLSYWFENHGANNKTGLLLIHGFTSTPSSLYNLAQGLQHQFYITHSPLLSGHGTLSNKMDQVNCDDWNRDIEAAYQRLKQKCDEVVVIGQSMGGALALNLAHNHPKIKQLFLLVPAVYPPTILKFQHSISKLCRFLKITHLPSKAGDIKKKDGYELSIKRIPIEIYRPLHDCFLQAQRACLKINIPTTIFATQHDHVLPPSGFEKTFNRIPTAKKEIIWLKNSYHGLSIDNDLELIIERVQDEMKKQPSALAS